MPQSHERTWHPHLEVLDQEECRSLLGSRPVGRLGLSENALPVVLPVNFVVDEDRILFISDDGVKLRAAREGAVACLEVDSYDTMRHSGWSVLVTGRLAEIPPGPRRDRAEQMALQAWALPAARHYVELGIDLMSGRRIDVP